MRLERHSFACILLFLLTATSPPAHPRPQCATQQSPHLAPTRMADQASLLLRRQLKGGCCSAWMLSHPRLGRPSTQEFKQPPGCLCSPPAAGTSTT